MKIWPFLFLVTCCAHLSDTASQKIRTVSAQAPANTLYDIVINSAIDEDTQAQFDADLKRAIKDPGVTEIKIMINSPGGSVGTGLDMIRAMKSAGKPTVCTVDGLAASMAFVIFEQCDVRKMTEASLLMGHTVSVGVQGQDRDLENVSRLLKALNRVLAHLITEKMSITVDEYEAYVANGGELWLDIDTAKGMGAID
jgi:ATP-dependent protease ClpP protease subunit